MGAGSGDRRRLQAGTRAPAQLPGRAPVVCRIPGAARPLRRRARRSGAGRRPRPGRSGRPDRLLAGSPRRTALRGGRAGGSRSRGARTQPRSGAHVPGVGRSAVGQTGSLRAGQPRRLCRRAGHVPALTGEGPGGDADRRLAARRVQSGNSRDSSFSPVVVTRGLAEYSAWTGSAEESLAWLERAYAISPEGEDWRIIASALYDKVRNDPRFTAGLQRARTQIYDRVRRASLGVAPK